MITGETKEEVERWNDGRYKKKYRNSGEKYMRNIYGRAQKYREKSVLRWLTLVETSMDADATLKFYFTFSNNFIYLFSFRQLNLIVFCVFNIYL
jgi:hypothetical protein